MRRTFARITTTAAATVGLAATTTVLALGLGEIDVSSNLNQRFIATIPLTEISAEDLETVSISLAPNEAFARAGVERADYLSTLDFQIKNDRGRPRVVVTSSQIAREPVLDLMVQASWSGGKILRDYTVLLDPADVAPPARPTAVPSPVVAVAPATVVEAPAREFPSPIPPPAREFPSPIPRQETAPSAPVIAKPNIPVGEEFFQTATEAKPAKKLAKAAAIKPAAAEPTESAADAAAGSYGPVATAETLWSIAKKVRPGRAVSMDQVILALAEANPVAIQRGTTVSKGTTLRVPSAERMQATSAAAATAKLATLRGGQGAVFAPAPAVTQAPAATAPAIASKPVVAATPTPTAVPTPAAAKPATIVATPVPTPVAPVAAVATPAATPSPAVAPSLVPTPAAVAAAVVAPTTAPTPEVAASTAVADAAALATPAASTPTPAAPPVASPATAAPVPPPVVKSPLAQPLPEQESPGLLQTFGTPLGLGALLVLLGAAAFALVRSRKAKPVQTTLSAFKAGDTSTVVAPAGGAGAVSRLGDTTRLSDTQTLGSKDAAAMAAADSTQQMTQPFVSSSVPAASHESTMILAPAVVASLNEAAKATASSTKAFDQTSQVHVETSHIDLADNDPLSEAEFHLAYGLYDEAILLLKTASAQQQQRIDLKVKLAETYFAAGRPTEFQEVAEGLKDKLSPAEWSKFAIMGAQICPDVALFQTADGDAGLDADFDLAFDEPEPVAPVAKPASNSIDFSLSLSEPTPQPEPLVLPDLKLSLDDDLHDRDQPLSQSQPPAGLDDNASIDFMLGQSLTPLGAGLNVPEPNRLAFNLGSPALNIEIPKFDITNSSPSPSPYGNPADDQPTITPGSDVLSLSLQDLEVSITPRQRTTESVDDDLNTKLDLARAYVEMGDNDMARSLLQEVQQQGSDRHQQEAAGLLQRLPA